MKKTEISFTDIFRALRINLLWIILASLVTGGLMWGYYSYVVSPTYMATVQLYAISNTARTEQTFISASEQEASRRLVDTYIVVIKSNAVMQDVSDKIREENGLHYSAGSISAMVNASSVNGTEIFAVAVTCSDPADAQIIANAIAVVSSTKVVEVLGNGGVSVVDYAKLPAAPIAPNVKKQTILGLLLGLGLSVLFVIIRDLYDTTIWTEEDLVRQYQIPVLGTIPRLEAVRNNEEKE